MSYTSNYRKENEQAKRLRKAAGSWLKGLRQDAGLTQAELSKRVGYEYYTFISQVECGAARVPSTDLSRWASALGLDEQEFAKELLGYYDPHWYKLLFPD